MKRPSRRPTFRHRRPSRKAWLLSAAACLLVVSAGGQEEGAEQTPQGTFEGQTTTLVVEVPVEVSLEGEPVRGLRKEHFRLYDGRREQEILSVEEIDLVRLGKAAAADPLQLPVAARRHFLLLFDRTYARPAALEKARQAAERLVAEDLHPADLVAVATYGRSRGVELLLGFTSDREQVITALAALDSESRLVSSDPLRLSIDSVSASGEQSGGGGTGARGAAAAAMEETARELRDLRDRAARSERVAEIGVMTRSLGALAESLRGLDGRKHVVLFSEGFDDTLLTGTQDDRRREEIQREVQDNALWRVDSTEYFGSTAAFDMVDSMNEFFRRSGAAVHTVDIGGLQAGGSATDIGREGGGSSLLRSGRGGLFMISDGTGGELLENFNDLGDAMDRLLEKTSVTYLLSFSPRDLDFDGSFHKLRVKVDDLPRRARVSHRAGYFAPGADSGGLGTQLDLASRLLDPSRGSIGVEIYARGRAPGEPMPVLVEVDAASFFAAPPGRQITGEGAVRAEIYVYAFTPEGRVAAHTARAAGLEPDALPEGEKSFSMQAPLELADGRYDLRVLVRNAATGQTGARRLPLELSPATDLVTTVKRRTSEVATAEGDAAAGADDAGRVTSEDASAMEAFEAVYSAALDRLEKGAGAGGAEKEWSFDALVAELAEAEAVAVGERAERGVSRLERLQARLSQERLSDESDELASLLVRQLVLHHDLALAQRRAGRAWLEHLGLERSRRLARALAREGSTTQDAKLAAAALASLGGALQAQGRRASRIFFEEAIEIDPSSEAARLGLAADYEKRGGPWSKVTRQLEALLEQRPESREGRLRLAINLLRASREQGAIDAGGKRGRAAEHFRRLLGEGDWLDALAAQELARLELEEGRLDEAQQILEAALERHAGGHDQALRVLLAYVLERARRPDIARARLATTAGDDAGEHDIETETPTPRARYNQWPSDALGEARALLRAVVEPSLTAAGQPTSTVPLGEAALGDAPARDGSVGEGSR